MTDTATDAAGLAALLAEARARGRREALEAIRTPTGRQLDAGRRALASCGIGGKGRHVPRAVYAAMVAALDPADDPPADAAVRRR